MPRVCYLSTVIYACVAFALGVGFIIHHFSIIYREELFLYINKNSEMVLYRRYLQGV